MERYISEKENIAINEFIVKYQDYVKLFESLNLKLEFSPVYHYYRDKRSKICYHTTRGKKPCFLALKVCIFPDNQTIKQAQKNCFIKKFYSKKIISYTYADDKIILKDHSDVDCLLILFLKKHLNKAKRLKKKNIDTKYAIEESLSDVFRSIFVFTRYRTEEKLTFHGKEADIYIVLVFVLIVIISWIIYWFRAKNLYP